MIEYYVYITKDKDGKKECHYYRGELNPIPKRYEFVGTAKVSKEYFGQRKNDKFGDYLNV